MADSDFWRDLASQFRSLDAYGMLRADWQYRVGSGDTTGWRLAGADRTVRGRFEALARRAGSAIAHGTSPDLLIAWFEALRKESPSFELGAYLTECNAGGTDGPHHQLGTIHSVCQASADYCNVLESRALEAEHLAKAEGERRTDPRNWSPLRQQWEALKWMKHRITGPHEEISEAWVRIILAQQYGITPEQVTSDQIRFEVSGLLQDYPAITLVPSGPSRDSDLKVDAQVRHNDVEAHSKAESIGAQLNRYREECRLTVQELAEKIDLTPRSVERHLHDDSAPYKRNLLSYERIFSKMLNRQIFITKMS